MSSWICNNCDTRFEGGLFNTRACPKCQSGIKDFFKVVWFFVKIAAVIVPVLFILKILKTDVYNMVFQSIANVADFPVAVYYNPSVYFNNILYVKETSYYTLRSPMQVFTGSDTIFRAGSLQPDQVVAVRGVLPKGDISLVAAEYYRGDARQRVFLIAPKDWDQVLSRRDFGEVMSRAMLDFRNAVFASLPYKEVAGNDYIKKFSEMNPDYYRLDIKDTSFFNSIFKAFAPQNDIAYFVKKEDRDKVEALRMKYLDRTVLEKELLKQK